MNNSKKSDKETFDESQNIPNNWKWGIFYYNKNDKRLFPPKRFGIGWTVNFANPVSIIAMLALGAALSILIAYL